MSNIKLTTNAKREEVYKFIANPKKLDGVFARLKDTTFHSTVSTTSGEVITYSFKKEFGYAIPTVTTKVTQINNSANMTVKTVSEPNFGSVIINIDYKVQKGDKKTELIIHWGSEGVMKWLCDSIIEKQIENLINRFEETFN